MSTDHQVMEAQTLSDACSAIADLSLQAWCRRQMDWKGQLLVSRVVTSQGQAQELSYATDSATLHRLDELQLYQTYGQLLRAALASILERCFAV